MNDQPDRIEPGGEVSVRPKVQVTCLCGATVIIGEHGPKNYPVALHPLPECKLFQDSDLVEYIQTLRRHYEGN